MAQTEKCPYCFADLMAAGLRENAWNRRLHVEKCSKIAQKRKKTKHVTLETFFKKQNVAAPAHQNETDVPNNESYEATKILLAELEDATSFSAGERSTSFHSHEPILPLIFEDTEISDSLSNRNGKVNAATSTLPLKRCMGYVPKEITSSVWTSFPFQALPLEKNQHFYFKNGR